MLLREILQVLDSFSLALQALPRLGIERVHVVDAVVGWKEPFDLCFDGGVEDDVLAAHSRLANARDDCILTTKGSKQGGF